MKKQLKYVGGMMLLGSFGFGMIGQAATTDKAPAYLKFDKGELSLVAIDYWNPTEPAPTTAPVVPTFDFGTYTIGNTEPQTVLPVGGNGSQSNVLKATGVANYLGDGSGWMVTLSATDFETKDYPKITGSLLSFEKLKAANVIGNQPIKNTSANKTVTTGKETSPIFLSEKGDKVAGKFQFDYSGTTLALSGGGAQVAKPTAYTSSLTWHLTAQSNDGKGQKAALPSS